VTTRVCQIDVDWAAGTERLGTFSDKADIVVSTRRNEPADAYAASENQDNTLMTKALRPWFAWPTSAHRE
jgi:hypothetical protein